MRRQVLTGLACAVLSLASWGCHDVHHVHHAHRRHHRIVHHRVVHHDGPRAHRYHHRHHHHRPHHAARHHRSDGHARHHDRGDRTGTRVRTRAGGDGVDVRVRLDD